MTHARQQIATKECTRAKEGKQADISKTSPGRVEKARCVVVCFDTMRSASCEALAMVNKNTAVRTDGFWRECRAGWRPVWHGWKWGWNAGGVGQQITFRSDAWRDECHGGVSIIGHGRCPCEGGQPRSILRAHPRCWTDAAACAPSRPSGCPGCMLRCWQSPTDMLPFVVGANVEKAPWGACDLTVDPHPLRTVDTPARDHGIGRPMRGSRLSATKPGGEQQASRRASGRRTSTTLAVGGRQGARSPQNVPSHPSLRSLVPPAVPRTKRLRCFINRPYSVRSSLAF